MNVDVCDRKLNFICEKGLFMNKKKIFFFENIFFFLVSC